MRIQIVVPCVNLFEKYTRACLDSIKTRHDYRILLIDNASTDETKVEAGKMVSDRFSHKRNEERWSCAQSWNYGVKDAWERGFDYCLVINNDIIIHPEAIDRMVDRFEREGKDSNLVMVTALDVRGECANPNDVLTKDAKSWETCPEAEHPNFSCFMINRQFTEIVGEFDEGFSPAYFEDNDAHYRINLSGRKAIVHPPALFYHYGSRTTNESLGAGKTAVSSRQFEANRDLYAEKWGGLPGKETFKYPFDREIYNIKATQQTFEDTL